MLCRGRTRRLDIRSLRRAFHDGTLNELLGRDEPIPEDSKRCQLCTQVKNLSNFRLLPRGGHESYCRDCNRLVRRGVKKGKKIEEVRQAYEVRNSTHVHMQLLGPLSPLPYSVPHVTIVYKSYAAVLVRNNRCADIRDFYGQRASD